MRISQSEMDLCYSETEPLIHGNDSRRTSYSTDNLSLASTMSTVADDISGVRVGTLVIISDNPRVEKCVRINADDHESPPMAR